MATVKRKRGGASPELDAAHFFDSFKKELSKFDPVNFAETYLTIDGKPFNISSAGWRFMADIYRSVAAQANNKEAKPIVLLKPRQIGATTMAAALSLYFTASGLYGAVPGKPGIRIIHLFPTIPIMHKYTKDKLEVMMRQSQDNYIGKMSLKNDELGSIQEDTLSEKAFMGYSKLRIDAIGKDGDRLRGLTQDGMIVDECLPYETEIEIEGGIGKAEIGYLVKLWKRNDLNLPRVMTYNERTEEFEYKKITNAWEKGERDLIQINCDNREIRCTENHKILTSEGWKYAVHLEAGDRIVARSTASGRCFTAVEQVTPAGSAPVYDIEVEDNHNFIVTGGQTGGCVFHNCQDVGQSAIDNALRILTAAQYGKKGQGVQLYFGTPKESGSFFWRIWTSSDQRFYQLRCISCDEYFHMYRYGSDDWKKIWLHGFTVECPSCKCQQDKRVAIDRGRWEPTARENDFVGYHLSLMLSPLFTREMINEYDPDLNKNRSVRAWKNETLGEFYSSGGLPLTFEEICKHATTEERGISKGVREITDKIYTLGVDWGEKNLDTPAEMSRGQSYTAMVVLSCNTSGVFTIENAFRLKDNNPSHRIKVVEELYERFKINTGAADYMYGNDVINHLQIERNYRTKLLACMNSGTLAKTLSYDPSIIRVMINKNLMIDEIFSMFRQGKIKFPIRGTSWDALLWLMKQCASMEVKKAIRGDNYVKTYIKGSIPNDGLMALMYAIVAYKFIATNGFSQRKEEHQLKSFPEPILAYAPSLR